MRINRSKHGVSLATLCLIILISCSRINLSLGDRDEAISAYANADDTIKIAVNKLSKISTTDPSLPSVKTRLNEAASYLDQSWIALMNMNYERSLQYSQASQMISAEALRDLTELDEPVTGLNMLMESHLTQASIEAIILSAVTFISWNWIKTFYVKKTLKSRLEVLDDES